MATADRRPQAGKTGTIDSNAAVWFVGYTPQVAGAAMISIDNQRSPFVDSGQGYRSSGLKGYRVPSTGLSLEGSGSGDAGQEIWKPAMERYLQGKAMQSFNAPPAELVAGAPVRAAQRPAGSRRRRPDSPSDETTRTTRTKARRTDDAELAADPAGSPQGRLARHADGPGHLLSRLVALPRM